MRRASSGLLAALLVLVQGIAIAALDTIGYSATGELAASAEQLDGRVTLTLESAQSIYDAQVYARAQGAKSLVGQAAYWAPGESRTFDLRLSSPHPLPGDYHLLLELAFRNDAGANQSVAIALAYSVEAPQGSASGPNAAAPPPSLHCSTTGLRGSCRRRGSLRFD